jgi:raffinose/stachyose/melibiose transport system substrate-binding protein
VDPLTRPLSRRQFLRYTAGGFALSTLAPVLAACGGEEEKPAKSSSSGGQIGGEMKLWWWGEQEAAGLKKWVEDTNTKFKTKAGVDVKANLLDTGQVIPQFTNAAAAGKPPDVQFLWNGIYHMENAWLGYLEPLNGVISDEVLEKSGATALSTFEGKQYRVGWYAIGMGVAYNKKLFEKAGLDADSPPETWDDLLAACEKLKAAGAAPFGGGVKDGYLGEWWLGHALTQNLDSPADAINLFIGELDWREPRYHEHWTRLEELYKAGFVNDDINSLELYQGIQLMDTSKLGITTSVSTLLPASQKRLGEDGVGFMVLPVFGTGALAGTPLLDSQGFGIPTKAENQEAAAAWIEYIHSEDRVNALYDLVEQIPANEGFDPAAIKNPLIKDVQERWIKAEHLPYIPNLMPTLFWTDAMFVASQKILGGEMTGEEAGDLAHEVTEKWKKRNPDLVENYRTWSEDLAAV